MAHVVDDLADIFPGRARFDPSIEADAVFASVPAKGCVALLFDAAGVPLQLLCTKNLRAMLRRRLGPPDAEEVAAGPTKRVDYRALVRAVAWRRVDSEFEMDLVYIDAARRAFPMHWRRLIPDRSAHFVAIDVREDHPDFLRTTDVAQAGNAALFGPFPDRAKADRWIDLARDAFDLCRYRNILAQTPNGRACAYKQMNKCAAPCDGTIALDVYRNGVSDAVVTLGSPAKHIEQLELAMREHATKLEFEQAGKVKGRLSTLAKLTEGANRGIRPIAEFRFVSVQPGPRKGVAKIFVMSSTAIVEVAAVVNATDLTLDDFTKLIDRPLIPSSWPAEVVLGTVCFHLSSTKAASRFIAKRDLTAEAFDAMLADASKQRSAADETGEAIRETRIET